MDESLKNCNTFPLITATTLLDCLFTVYLFVFFEGVLKFVISIKFCCSFIGIILKESDIERVKMRADILEVFSIPLNREKWKKTPV